jgi:hypothetical protein
VARSVATKPAIHQFNQAIYMLRRLERLLLRQRVLKLATAERGNSK